MKIISTEARLIHNTPTTYWFHLVSMTDEPVEATSANEIPAECPTSVNGRIGPEGKAPSSESDTAIIPTIAINTTEVAPIVNVAAVAPVTVAAPPTLPQVESRVNSQHVDTLQSQIRLFKNLSQKFLDSTIPKQLDANNRPILPTVHQTSASTSKLVAQPPAVPTGVISLPLQIKQKPIPLPVPIPTIHTRPVLPYAVPYANSTALIPNNTHISPRPQQNQIEGVPLSTKVDQKHSDVKGPENTIVAAPPAPPLSWQCFSSLMFIGPPRPTEGMISIAPSVSDS